MATYTFTPPTAQITPAYLPDTKGLQYLLFRYFQPRTRGVNVYCLSNGSFAQDYPTKENSNTNFPLPYNPTDPAAPFAQWNDTKGNTYFSTLPVHIVNIYYGGHLYTIDEETKNRLQNAGYGTGEAGVTSTIVLNS
jgi:hypothetical protein